MKSLFLMVLFISCLPLTGQAKHKKVLGNFDSRRLSQKSGIARLSNSTKSPGGCTGTLIGKTCMISAGHCAKDLKFVEFKTRGTKYSGEMRKTKKENIFKVDPKSINSIFDLNKAEDWVVFRVQKNKLKFWKRVSSILRKGLKKTKQYRNKNGYYPGDIQRIYKIQEQSPTTGSYISITGYGRSVNILRSLNQQMAFGRIVQKNINYSIEQILHDVDTEGGVSGAAMMDTNNKIVGIHTGGMCRYSFLYNRVVCINAGIGIQNSFRFKRAIQKCLEWEEDNL